MKFSEKQRALLGLKKVKQKIICIIGAIRSGKSIVGGIGFVELTIEQQKENPVLNGNRYAIVGHANQKATYTNVLINMLQHYERRGFKVQKNGVGYDYIVTRGNITIYLETFSVSDSVSYRRLQGGTYRSVFLDEAPLYTEGTTDRIMERCATFKDHKAVMTGNAEGNDAHYFYQKYLNGNEDVFHIKFNMMDNPLNDEETIEHYKKIFTAQTFKQRILGEWVSLDGAVYPKVPKVYETRPEKFDFILCGLDYGESDATTVVPIGVDVKNECYYIIGQMYHKNGNGSNLTISDYTVMIEDYIEQLHEEEQTKIFFTVETSPSTVYNTLRTSERLLAHCDIQKVKKKRIDQKNKSSIKERIHITNALIGYDKLFIVSKDLPIYKAFKNAVWKNDIRLDNGKIDIDSLDAFEYGLSPDFKSIYINYFKGGQKRV